MATKEHKRHARGLIEELEARVHAGPPVNHTEIASAREFLRQNDFAASSDYFGRLSQIQDRLATRPGVTTAPARKRNYGGLAAGRWMQLLSIYDHVILSTCYEGEFGTKEGKIKISHRFNQAGRIDFVELKFLRSLHTCLNGEVRTLIRVKDYQQLRREWWAAEAFVLPVLPRELIFLHEDLFRFPRNQVLAWLINIGHRLAADLIQEWITPSANGKSRDGQNAAQLPLTEAGQDLVARPILQSAAELESDVEPGEPSEVVIRYLNRDPNSRSD